MFHQRCISQYRIVRILLSLAIMSAWAGVSVPSHAGELHIVTGDNPGVEFVNFMAAVENARKRGADIRVSYFNSENIAAEAVVAGIADLAIGTPYNFIHKSTEPVRMIAQLSRLRFHPMVNSARYKTWQDLEGAKVFVHGPGSGTEAIMGFMAQKHRITYGGIHYLPGSNVRATAMLQGRINASILDTKWMKLLLRRGGGRFAALPMDNLNITDEALFGKLATIKAKQASVEILLEEIVRAWRMVNANPASVTAGGRARDALEVLSKDEREGVVAYYRNAVDAREFPDNGGMANNFLEDLKFYAAAGSIGGEPEQLVVENFWYLPPLQNARAALGKAQK